MAPTGSDGHTVEPEGALPGPASSAGDEDAARIERPLLTEGLREARVLLEAFHRAEIARDGRYGEGASTLTELEAPHQLLLEAIRRTDAITHADDDGLFFRGSELAHRYSALEKITAAGGSPHAVAEAAGAYLGTANRLLDALIIEFLDDEEELEHARARRARRLDEGLAIRRAFADFRIALEHGKTRPDLLERLESATEALSSLLDSETRHWLRASDRNVFRDLQARLRRALADDRPDRRSDAEAIYEDLLATTSILSAVNHREELKNRDRKLAYQLPDVLLGPATSDVLETLWEFYGLSTPLDIALAEGDEIRDHHLAALRASLGLP